MNDGTSNLIASIFNMIKAIMGAGILSIPFAFARVGWTFAIILMIIVCLLSMTTVYMLIICSDQTKCFSYIGLPKILFGEKSFFHYITFLSVFGYVFCGCVIYSIVTMNLIGLFSIQYKFFIYCFLNIFILFPVCIFARDMSKLKYTSFFGIFGIFFMLVICVIEYVKINIYHYHKYTLHIDSIRTEEDFFLIFPIFIFAFDSQFGILDLYGDLKNRSNEKMKKVIFISFFICFFIYLIFGMFGYFTFGEFRTKPNILHSYKTNNLLIISMKCFFIIIMFCTYPIFFFILRGVFENFFYNIDNQKNISTCRFIMETITLQCFILFLTKIIPNILFIIGFGMSIFGSLVSFVLPSLFYIRLININIYSKFNFFEIINEMVILKNNNFYEKMKINIAYLILFFGFFAMIGGLYSMYHNEDN